MSILTMVPREMHLRLVLADLHAKDALVAAGTGSGKTLPTPLCILLDKLNDNRKNKNERKEIKQTNLSPKNAVN